MKNKIMVAVMGLLIVVTLNSCKKYLEVKPSTAYSTITTVADATQLLNNSSALCSAYVPNNGEFSADDYYLNTSDYNAIYKNYGRGNVYLWGKYPYLNDPAGGEWRQSYAGILVCNMVIDALERITISESDKHNADYASGTAFAYRAYILWKLAIVYSKAYNSSAATTDLGIPLRLGISLDEKLNRGNVQQTYDQIIKDFTAALPLLPSTPTDFTKPSKSSVNAMLAEVYLSMGNYEQAAIYANASLNLKNDLINYNDLDPNSSVPLPVNRDNVEILAWYSGNATGLSGFHSDFGINIDTLLYQSYKDDDLRKQYFFTMRDNGTYYFKGNYSNNISYTGLFTGPTTAEMYLTRAECLARQGKTREAMEDLNTLMKNRIINSPSISYIPYNALNANDAIQLILQERRKELVFRDLRWMDIKRLNVGGANITLTRNIDGKVYTLPPNDNRFALQLPETVIQLSGIEQNPY